MRPRIHPLAAVASVVLLGAAPALAAGWSSAGSGTAGVQAGALAAPGTGTAGSATATSLTVSWAAPASGATASGYEVLRDASLVQSGGCASTTTRTTTNTTCVDTGLTAGATHSYTVRAVKGSNWVGPSNSPFSGTTAALAMHVSAVTGLPSKDAGVNWKANAEVTVTDAYAVALPDVTVSVTFGSGGGTKTCVTLGTGTCKVQSEPISDTTASASVTVTNLTKATYSYDSVADVGNPGIASQ